MSEGPILVTGVSGYIASHVAKILLEEGHQVRGTVRSLENEAKVEPLRKLVPDAKYPLELVEADLTKDDGWDKAVADCTGVMHMASPFPDMVMSNPTEEELVGPAKEGTLRVLKAVAAPDGGRTVKRVVLTSSFASVHGEITSDPEKAYNESDWTDPEAPGLDFYTKSKVLAEKAAWEYVKELPDDQKFELAVINPVFVLGPPLMESHKSSTSVNYMSQVMNKAYPALPKVNFPICDVRDVAKAHVKALTLPEAADSRHIISTDSFWFRDLAVSAAKEFRQQGYSVPTGQLPSFVVWVAGLFNKSLKDNIIPRLGKPLKADNTRMKEKLGIEPTSLDSTVQDMVYAMVELGILRKAKKYRQVGSRAEVPVANGEAEDGEKKEDTEKEATEDATKEKELEPEDKEATYKSPVASPDLARRDQTKPYAPKEKKPEETKAPEGGETETKESKEEEKEEEKKKEEEEAEK